MFIGRDRIKKEWDRITQTVQAATDSLRPSGQPRKSDMTAPQLQNLSALVKNASNLKDRINATTDRVAGSIKKVEDSLGHAENFSTQLEKVADDLHSALGLHGNLPPAE